MTLATSLQALLAATSGLEELSSRHETADALFGFDRGQVTENELAEVGDYLLGDLDDRSLSGTAAWEAASVEVQRILHPDL